jgi:hypothetical protein
MSGTEVSVAIDTSEPEQIDFNVSL